MIFFIKSKNKYDYTRVKFSGGGKIKFLVEFAFHFYSLKKDFPTVLQGILWLCPQYAGS